MMDSNEMNILAIIPARGDIKVIPRKNLRLLAGKPLIVHTIDCTRLTKSLSRSVDARAATAAKTAGTS